MKKVLIGLFLVALLFIFTGQIRASTSNAFVSVVNPVRGQDFWSEGNQKPVTAVLGEKQILEKYKVLPTWLIRFDALNDSDITKALKNSNGEKGLFLEITPTWTDAAAVTYNKSATWHSAGSILLTGYDLADREKLIDTAFDKFKQVYGSFPKSVGAWWIDAYSLNYMQQKYGITASLIVADQYTTDNYQIWGQYWSTPYYPAKQDALNPAQTSQNKIPVVMMQWAARDPVNAYGSGVEESTYSVQANDYLDYHNLSTNYFSKLIDIYTTQKLNKFGQIVVGLENSYPWDKYEREYENQIKTITDKNQKGQLSIVPMVTFANWYISNFPEISPEQVIVAEDPLGTSKKAVWFMSPYYRIGWFYNQDGSVIRYIRQYIDGGEELCYKRPCNELNFATFATRVLDDVTYHHQWVIDEGRIANFQVDKQSDNYVISYTNETSKTRTISLMPRDIGVDSKVSSIDGAILDATKKSLDTSQKNPLFDTGKTNPKFDLIYSITSIFKFLSFYLLIILIPGLSIVEKIEPKKSLAYKFFLSSILGLVGLTLIFYILSRFHLQNLIYLYPIPALIVFIKNRGWSKLTDQRPEFSRNNILIGLLILIGTIFQVIPIFKTALLFDYGIGFWGPNAHDGVWHIALINQLLKSIPPVDPIFSGPVLYNYHYFYDLLVAATAYIIKSDVLSLVFRFYPVVFSLLLGIGSVCLINLLFRQSRNLTLTTLISLFLIYFAGSFGWIVEFIKQRHLGGESAFWANQSVSFNLNPPFAISLLITIAIILLFAMKNKSVKKAFLLIILAGTLIGFKAYAAVLVLTSLLIFGVVELIKKRQFYYLVVFGLAGMVTATIYLINFGFKGLSQSGSLFIFAPFWFINSMIDSPDRIGWERLSIARYYSLQRREWFKFLTVELIGLGFFLIGNLGMRCFGFIKMLNLKIFQDEDRIFVWVLSFFSLVIPLIFVQSGTPWNSIQFLYYFMYIAAVFTGPALADFFNRFKILALPLMTLFLMIAPINSIVTAIGYLGDNPHAWISNSEMNGLKFLSEQTDGFVLTYPYDKSLKSKIGEPWELSIYDDTAYVAAFSGKPTFLADESQNGILLTDYKKRSILSKSFFTDMDFNKKEFLATNKIKYVYIPKIYGVTLNETTELKKIFEDNGVLIYKIEE